MGSQPLPHVLFIPNLGVAGLGPIELHHICPYRLQGVDEHFIRVLVHDGLHRLIVTVHLVNMRAGLLKDQLSVFSIEQSGEAFLHSQL